MEIIKKINNNVAIAIDDNGNELVVIGKGVGFPAVPYMLTDLTKVDKTFYGVSNEYIGLLADVKKEIFDIASAIMNYASSQIDNEFNPNIIFTLADHINFAVERYKKNIYVKTPFVGDLKILYEKEYNIALKAVNYINRVLNIKLDKNEATSIALHLINSENFPEKECEELNEEETVDKVIDIIEEITGKIDRNSFNCIRFVSHLRYLIKRLLNGETLNSDNVSMLKSLSDEYPLINECALKVQNYLEKVSGKKMSEEERVYLIIHINRLATREENR